MARPFLTSELDRVEWSATRSCRFTPGEKFAGTHWIGGWVDPRAGVDAVKRSILYCWESDPVLPAHSPSLYRLSHPDSPYINILYILCILNQLKPKGRFHFEKLTFVQLVNKFSASYRTLSSIYRIYKNLALDPIRTH
jgi:hypothetical protein